MHIWERIVRYLILWGILLVILVVISVIRHWDFLVGIVSATFSSYLSMILTIALFAGLIIWGFRLILRPL